MLTKINSCSLYGISGVKCTVEIDTSKGIPTINLVGQMNKAAKEIRQKAITAIKNSGFKYKPGKLNINILPANIPKVGTSLDLPICVGILSNLGYIKTFIGDHIYIIGELSLTGDVVGISGILPMLQVAKESGCKIAFIPYSNLSESLFIEGITVIGINSLYDLVERLNHKNYSRTEFSFFTHKSNDDYPLFENIFSLDTTIRAALIAASGFHNMILSGPNGIGKTLICTAMQGILPSPDFSELSEINSIHSASDLLRNQSIVDRRPFRAPPVNISSSFMLGSDFRLKPGEITLAHNGILFLDEINHFKSDILNSLRVPLEKGFVSYHRDSTSVKFPCKFLLLGTMNACPCGNYPDIDKCTCSYKEILNYRKRFSTPFLDRIDLFINLSKPVKKFSSSYKTEDMKKIVNKVKSIQFERNGNIFNSRLSLNKIEFYSYLSGIDKNYLMDTLSKLNISFRGYARVLKISRTIADLDFSEIVKRKHIDEALIIERGRQC